MNKEPIIFITKPEKQLIEKDNLEIEINNYDNSHLYYKGFDLGTFKEIVNLRQENQKLKKKYENAVEELELVRCDLHNRTSERDGAEKQNDLYKKQQKEFIKYLEDKIKYFKDLEQFAIKTFNNKAVINLDLVKRSIEEDNLLIHNFEEILQKYKEIIGDD